jgi:threonine dehydrogenase-like Zn-dependent dehydrogenase
VEYAVPEGGSLLVLGLGPIGDMVCRIAQQKWIDKIIGVDLVDERLERALARGVQVIDLREHEDDLPEVVRELTDGRGPDSVIDVVGMEAPGSPGAAFAQRVTAHLPDAVTDPLMKKAWLPHHKTLDEFDFVFQPDLNARKVRDLATLEFVPPGRTAGFRTI